jgi:ankyrin repeat protein
MSAPPAAAAQQPAAGIVSAAAPRRRRPRNIIAAAKKGDVKTLKELIAEGMDVDKRGMWESTPLICACQYGREEAALALMELGANVAAVNEKGVNPLLLASLEGLPGVVDAILAKVPSAVQTPASVYNAVNDKTMSFTPLLAASITGRLEIVKKLLLAGADANELISTATASNDTKAAAASKDDNTTNSFVMSSLLGACFNGHSEVAALLLDKDASIDVLGTIPTCDDCTPLILACKRDGAQINKDGDPNDQVKVSCTAVATVLLSRGASPNIVAKNGKTALHYAAECGNDELVKVLLAAGALPDTQDAKGASALWCACKGSASEAVVSALIGAGSNPNLKDKSGLSAIAVAKAKRRGAVLAIMEQSDNGEPSCADSKDGGSDHADEVCNHAGGGANDELKSCIIDAGAVDVRSPAPTEPPAVRSPAVAPAIAMVRSPAPVLPPLQGGARLPAL